MTRGRHQQRTMARQVGILLRSFHRTTLFIAKSSAPPRQAGIYNRVTMSEPAKRSEKLCTVCGRPIPAARLEALPGVTICVECARKFPPKVDKSRVDLSEASQIN